VDEDEQRPEHVDWFADNNPPGEPEPEPATTDPTAVGSVATGSAAIDSAAAGDAAAGPAEPDSASPDSARPDSATPDSAAIEDDDAPTEMVPVQRRKRGGVILGRTVVAVVSALALVATGVAWFTLEQFKANTNTTDALSAVNSGQDDIGASTAPAPPADDGATDILLVGSDSRTDAQGNELPTSVLTQLRTQWDAGVNTDTIMILRVPKNGGKAYAVSIPRDTYVNIPGIGPNKINSAYGLSKARKDSALAGSGMSQHDIEAQGGQAGQEALIETVQNLTGIRIDHYAEVNLYGFYLLSKAIGGVPVCLKHATSDKDSGSNFSAGEHLISGADALSFVRQRENLPDGDLDRIVRQQVFLAAAAKKMLSAGVLANPSALAGLMDTVHKSLVTDPGLDLLTLIEQAQSLVSGNVEFVTIPVTNTNARSPSGQSIVSVDLNQVHQFVASLVGSATPATSTPATAPHTSPVPAAPTSAPAATAPAAPAGAANEPTAPVTVDGTRCVD
jgi:LCP family protein required for cell wall assembly